MAQTDPDARSAAAALAATEVAPLPWTEFVWRCWHRLHQDRTWHGGGFAAATPGRIAWRDVMAWADRYQCDAEFLDEMLGQLDAVFVTWHREQVAN